jgi:hypothetical protein
MYFLHNINDTTIKKQKLVKDTFIWYNLLFRSNNKHSLSIHPSAIMLKIVVNIDSWKKSGREVLIASIQCDVHIKKMGRIMVLMGFISLGRIYSLGYLAFLHVK